MVKVKICGITNLEDAKDAVGSGCDALGFVFYKKSPRYISPKKVTQIVRGLPRQVIKIGVFVNARESFVKRVVKLCGLKMLQFHGDESPQFVRRFSKYKVIKAFRVKDKLNLKDIYRYNVFAYLFDTYVPGKSGGTGKSLNWELVRHIDGLKRPVFLSGGLHAGNVEKAIEVAHPDWVDASSSLEIRPGKKDPRKVKRFIQAVKSRRGSYAGKR